MKTLAFTSTARRHRHEAAARRTALQHDLDMYTTQADLHELAAVLQRYDDTAVAPVRDAIDWTRAA